MITFLSGFGLGLSAVMTLTAFRLGMLLETERRIMAEYRRALRLQRLQIGKLERLLQRRRR